MSTMRVQDEELAQMRATSQATAARNRCHKCGHEWHGMTCRAFYLDPRTLHAACTCPTSWVEPKGEKE